MNKSAKMCIEENDFKSAFQRYEKANRQWKEYWYETCKTILESPKCKKEYKDKYVVHPRLKTIEKLNAPSVPSTAIIWECEPLAVEKGVEQLYIVRFLDRHKQTIIYGKVGTTTRSIKQRMNEELKYYHDSGAKYVVVERVYDCSGIPAEGLESLIRAYFIKHNPTAFKKNDRFCGMPLNLEEVDKLIALWENFVLA